MDLLDIQNDLLVQNIPIINEKKKIDPVETLLKANEPFFASVMLGQRLHKNPKETESIIKMGLCMEARGYIEDALKCYEQLVRIDETPYSMTLLGNCLLNLKMEEQALSVFLDALLIENSDITVYFEIYKNIGNIYVRRGDFDLAEDFYNKAYAIKPKSDALLVNYGTLAIQHGDETRALEKFRSALSINIKNDKAWIGLALVHNNLGDQELAWGNLKTALELNPKNKTAVELCCHWAHRDKTYSVAVEYLDQYIERSNFENDISMMLIETLIHLSDFTRAHYEVEKALLWDPKNIQFQRIERAIRSGM